MKRKPVITEINEMLSYSLSCLVLALTSVNKDAEIELAKNKILAAKDKLDEIERC